MNTGPALPLPSWTLPGVARGRSSLFRAMLAVMCAGAAVGCSEDGSPSGNDDDRSCVPSGPAPEDSHWRLTREFTDRDDVEVEGTGASWNRPAGILTIQDVGLGLIVQFSEPAVQIEDSCGLLVTDAALAGVEDWYYDRARNPRHALLDHLSDSAISGSISDMSMYFWDEGDRVEREGVWTLEFSAVAGCSPASENAPERGMYTIENALVDHPDSNLTGVKTRWSPSIGVIALGEDPVCTPDPCPPESTPSWGMNLIISEPIREKGTECVLTLVSAELTMADQRSGSPDELNVRYYVFPPESGYPTEQNDLLKVDYLADPAISVTPSTIPMQRRVFSPTGGFEWRETINVKLSFDALK